MTVFSHRPQAGISVGARSQDGVLYVAFAVVNDGTSRNGIMWNERRDTFSRRTARQIINGRIDNMLNDKQLIFKADENGTLRQERHAEHKFGFSVYTETSDRKFMAELRKLFKPTVNESDNVFSDIEFFGETEVRYRASANDIIDRLDNMFHQVLQNQEVTSCEP